MNRLCRKHPVERVFVLANHSPRAKAVLHRNCEQQIARFCHGPDKVIRQNVGGMKPA